MRLIDNVLFRVKISVEKHKSNVIAVVGHIDCAAVTETNYEQKQFIQDSVKLIKKWDLGVQVIGL